MFCYRDMTFCMRECANYKCKRNKKHLENIPEEEAWMPIAFSEFKECKNYKEVK